jgi:hypothetical protein
MGALASGANGIVGTAGAGHTESDHRGKPVKRVTVIVGTGRTEMKKTKVSFHHAVDR